MDNSYNKFFFTEYDTQDYSNRDLWFTHFDRVAEKIVEYFEPKTVLDAGCAMGYLVEALRRRGVEAYGIDISSYAIESSAPEVRPYLNVQSITAPLPESFPTRFDLVLSIEVLEHLFPEDGKRAIAALCALTDTFIFTSTPDDIDDKNHLNVQQKEYWAKIFAENSFYRDLVQPVDFIASWGLLFRRKTSVPEVIFNYEMIDRIDKTRERRPTPRIATVFFDTGAGIVGEGAHSFSYYGSELVSGRIALPAGCRAVRIDPIEDAFSSVSALSVITNAGISQPASHNAEYASDGVYYFTNTDPQLYYEFSTPAAWLEISAEIFATAELSSFVPFTRLVSGAVSASGERAGLSAQIEGLSAEINRINGELEERSTQLDEANRHISAQDASLKAGAEHRAQLEAEISRLGELLSGLEMKKAVLADELSVRTAALEESKKQSEKLEEELTMAMAELEKRDYSMDEYRRELAHYKLHYEAAIHQREELTRDLTNVRAMYDNVAGAFFWKITKPARVIMDLLKRLFKRLVPRKLARGFRCLRENGLRYTLRKIRDKRKNRHDYEAVRHPLYTRAEMAAQRQEVFSKDVKFSILVPLYNTPKKFLHEMIRSVLDQTYSNFELCLADGSDKKHKYVGKIAKSYAKRDKRVLYKKLAKNGGISRNTNASIEMSSGDYVSLFDHDDLLHPSALYDVMRAICEHGADFIYTDEDTFHFAPKDAYCPHFKPDYAPDTLRTNNYICHLTTFRRSLLDEVGVFRPECDGSQDFDMVLRLTEKAEKIVHIPKILYYWRAHAASVATDVSAKPYVITAAHKAIADHLERIGLEGEVKDTVVPSMYRIDYKLTTDGKVSIIIANKDHIDDLDKCIKSIVTKSTYPSYEIVVVENNSTEPETFKYYEDIKAKYGVKVVTWVSENGTFNYSAINNCGVRHSDGEYVLLLNNDTEVISPSWIEEMLMFCQRPDVGAVGAKLYYPDDTIQHAGLGIGLLTLAGHYFRGFPRSHPGYMGRLIYAHNVSGVTAACVMLSRRVWDELSGLDESFEVAFNDVDLCMRIRAAGYLIVWTPFAELYHYESKSRGLDNDPVKRERFVGEVTRFQKKWRRELDAGDPYYNPNFSLDSEDFSVK